MRGIVINFMKSIIIGASVLIPGVSGATMAIALGVYDRLLCAAAHFYTDKKKNATFLLTFLFGAVIGAYIFSNAVFYIFKT